MIDIERLSDLELDQMQATYEKIKAGLTKRQAKSAHGAEETPRGSQEK
jgi:hypothetical protein